AIAPDAMPSIAVTLWNVHLAADISVIDAPGPFVPDPEILSDFVHLDFARAIIPYYHRATHVAGVDATGAVAFDGERPGYVADFDLSRAILNIYITADVLDSETA